MKKSEALLRLIRPAQWIKNFFVFAPILFGGALFNIYALLGGIITFFAFSFAASSIYCFNDIHDVADDRRHPEKCHRPIACGAVSVPQAYGLMMLMFALSIGCCLLLTLLIMMPGVNTLATLVVIVFYWLLNLAYCVRLKQYAIVDVCIVAFGFVLRMVAGGGDKHHPKQMDCAHDLPHHPLHELCQAPR